MLTDKAPKNQPQRQLTFTVIHGEENSLTRAEIPETLRLAWL